MIFFLTYLLPSLSLIALSKISLAVDVSPSKCKFDPNSDPAIYCTDRPVIGIYTSHRNCASDSPQSSNTQYIATSYVKWMEQAGARSVPIPFDANNETIDSIFHQINGLLLPGGSELTLPDSLHRLYELAMAENDSGGYFPIWSVCLGFQRLAALSSREGQPLLWYLNDYDAEDMSVALDLKEPGTGSLSSTIFHNPEILRILSKEPVAMNAHVRGLSPSRFLSDEHMNSTFRILSTNKDRKGEEFVSTIEARQYPFYGLQWHPEKNNFEYGSHDQDIPNQVINHSVDAIEVSFAMASVFVRDARKNGHVYTGDFPLVWNITTMSTETKTFDEIFYLDGNEWNRKYVVGNTNEKPQLRAVR